ncbi:MAG: hypothetical protein U9Q21_03855, partial [Candidatus Auribacterota bacterium]|nr:hypothetical protein [Candidatus Auribacterota bacterium]
NRPNAYTTSYTAEDISDYLFLNPNTVVVQRINNSDEAHAEDSGYNRRVLDNNELADSTVFVSSFIKGLIISHGFNNDKPHVIIHTGADEDIFNSSGRAIWRPGEKMKIVTHHWSSNTMKGIDVYERLDLLLGEKRFGKYFEFAYVGNLPLGFEFRNTRVVSLLHGQELANNLKEHHAYITGARYEAGGNHYIEAMRCGLPVLYLGSGSTGEYCSRYGGVEFNPVNFEEKLLEFRRVYPELREKVLQCPFSAIWMAVQYEEIFTRLVAWRREYPRPKPGTAKVIHHYAYSYGKKINSLRRALFQKLAT